MLAPPFRGIYVIIFLLCDFDFFINQKSSFAAFQNNSFRQTIFGKQLRIGKYHQIVTIKAIAHKFPIVYFIWNDYLKFY